MSESVPCAFLVFSSLKKNNRGVEGGGAKRGSALVSRATLCFEGGQPIKLQEKRVGSQQMTLPHYLLLSR